MSLKFTVISANNVPIADLKTSDPYVKLYVDGPIKVYLCKTSTIKSNLNPKWNETFLINTVRGARIYLDVYDESLGNDTQIAHTAFDPMIHPFGAEVNIPLIPDINKGGENCSIKVFASFKETNPPPNSTSTAFQNPHYITFEPDEPVVLRPPLIESRANALPYPIPFQLSAILYNKGDNSTTIVDADNRSENGVSHSGHHPVLSFKTFTQSIRIDPSLLIKKGVSQIFIAINTQDITTLQSLCKNGGFLTIWDSFEKGNNYKKGSPYRFDIKTRKKEVLLTPVQRIKVNFEPSAVFTVVANAVVSTAAIRYNPGFVFLPNSNADGFITPQSPHAAVRHVLQYEAGVAAALTQLPHSLPICAPTPLSTVFTQYFGITSGSEHSILRVKVTGNKDHQLYIAAFRTDLSIADCITDKKANLCENAIVNVLSPNVFLDRVPDDVSFICFCLCGDKPLAYNQSKEFLKVKIPTKEVPQPQCVLGLMGGTDIQNFPVPASKTRTSFMWFILFREPFGGWAFLSLRLPVEARNAAECVECMKRVIVKKLK
ncbi:C2 domain containing protein [Trichomonas vaginalis G3]|uniref:C2 domain containing protein n=1 Tax=Trichomonas vaginalis (strain ATCC PRA-98 / G3) TaxID=412133 RepID=A2FYD1_TRIV3|nr:C2 domain containing protein [Trichomonas vaginalis G3]|eukprot:XP_001303025.1 C2 domain containing protein [Trichomonas vaginalis G3]